jgi:exodeoxyribonuclease VII large subunit
MQGEHAPKSIIAALDTIANQEEEWDVVVIIRGGGATTDLTCFDDYNLCNHCAQFPLPIITGIGHTKDVSVLDMVSFAPLKTPTAVAQYFVDGRLAQAQRLRDLEQRLRRIAENILLVRRHKIELLTQRLAMCSPERIYKMGYSLVTAGSKVIRSAADLQAGERITTHFLDGEKEAIVQ